MFFLILFLLNVLSLVLIIYGIYAVIKANKIKNSGNQIKYKTLLSTGIVSLIIGGGIYIIEILFAAYMHHQYKLDSYSKPWSRS